MLKLISERNTKTYSNGISFFRITIENGKVTKVLRRQDEYWGFASSTLILTDTGKWRPIILPSVPNKTFDSLADFEKYFEKF